MTDVTTILTYFVLAICFACVLVIAWAAIDIYCVDTEHPNKESREINRDDFF
jgi:hypothetical protein